MSEMGFAAGSGGDGGGNKKGAKAKPGKAGKKPGKKKKAKRAPSPRVKIYAAEVLKGKSKKEAALVAGYSQSMADNPAHKIERPNQDYFRRLMDEHIPDELMAIKTREGLDATVIKIATFEGRITDAQAYADFPTRAKYLEMAAEFKGRVQRGGGQVNVNLPVMLVHSVPRPDRGEK